MFMYYFQATAPISTETQRAMSMGTPVATRQTDRLVRTAALHIQVATLGWWPKAHGVS